MIRSIGVALAIVGGTVLTIPRGTDIPVTLDEDVSIAQERVGDKFEAHVTRDVVVNGEVVIPAGAPAEVKLVKSPDDDKAATLRLTGVNVDGEVRSVNTDVAKADGDKSGLSTGEKTAVGAAAGVFAELEPDRAAVEVPQEEGVEPLARDVRGDAGGGGRGAGSPG